MDGHEVRRWRKWLGMSQQDLAAALGVHPITVSKWEQNKATPPPMIGLALEMLDVRRREEGRPPNLPPERRRRKPSGP